MKIITASELKPACHYIQTQFELRSWWPKEQPHKAKQEFELMNQSEQALSVWCERWLDSGQIRNLKKAIEN